MLQVEDLSVHYGRLAAVKNVSMEVAEGELVGLIGPNGAGKSSTMAAIAGLVAPSGGVITFRGTSIAGRRPEDVARLGVSLVPERRRIFSTLTVAENLRLGTTLQRGKAQIAQDTDHMLELFPVLKRYLGTSAAMLSGGEQQQLAIARALLARPALLLLDEPSLGLAPLVIRQVFDTLQLLKSEGTTILLVEQIVAESLRIADRVIVPSGGRVSMHGPTESLQASTDFVDAYLGVHP